MYNIGAKSLQCGMELLFSTTSSGQLAKVDILKDMLLFRDDPNLCIGLFVNDEISTAINCICTE